MCAVSYREVNEVARAIDADITVVSLEPTTIEGILNTITTVGAMTEAEDAAIDLVESLRERLGAVGEKVQARRDAGGRSPRVVGLEWLDPPFATGHWVPEQIRQAGGWELLGSDGEASTPDDLGRGLRRRSGDAPPDAVRLPPAGDHRGLGGDAPPARATRTSPRSGAARSSRSTARPTSAGRARGSSTGSSCWPRSSIRTRSSTSRPSGLGAGRRLTAERRRRPGAVPRDASTACGAARRRTTCRGPRRPRRAGRSSARTASARPVTTGSCASASARP